MGTNENVNDQFGFNRYSGAVEVESPLGTTVVDLRNSLGQADYFPQAAFPHITVAHPFAAIGDLDRTRGISTPSPTTDNSTQIRTRRVHC